MSPKPQHTSEGGLAQSPAQSPARGRRNTHLVLLLRRERLYVALPRAQLEAEQSREHALGGGRCWLGRGLLRAGGTMAGGR